MLKGKHFTLKGIFPFLIVAFLGILPLAYSSPFFVNSLILAFMFGLSAKGWDVLGGYAGQFSLGHAVFFGLGAYICGISFAKFNINPWLSMIVGMLMGSIFAVLIGYPCFRLKGHYFVLATVAFNTAIQFLFLNWEYVGGAGGLWFPVLPESAYNFQFKSKLPYYYFIYVVTIIWILLSYKIDKSKLSLMWKAIREDEDAAMSIGINASKYKAIAALISGMLVGFSGSFYALYFLYIDPYSVMSFEISAMLVIMSVVGGSGSLIGPFIGSFLYVPLSEYIRAILGVKVVGFHMVVFGALLIIVALFFPGGIMGFLSKHLRRLR